MNLTMNTQWSTNDRRTYLIVTVSADSNAEATASQIYLDIQMPEGVRIRHLGNLPSDGHGNSIGVDLPDLGAGDHQNIVFKLKSRRNQEDSVAPELHLHWIDSASDDLVERHQTGTHMPTEPIEADEDLTEIVSAARSTHQPSRRHRGHAATPQENEHMNTERHNPSHSRRPHRCGAQRDSFGPDREFRRGGRHADRHGMGSLHRTITEMQDRIDEMERRMHRMLRMQRMAKRRRMHGAGAFEERESCRETGHTHHEDRSDRRHREHRMQHEGRRMGRMMYRAWHERHPDA